MSSYEDKQSPKVFQTLKRGRGATLFPTACLPFNLCVDLFVYSFGVCLSIYHSFSVLIYLSIYLFVCLSAYLSIYPSIYVSIFLGTNYLHTQMPIRLVALIYSYSIFCMILCVFLRFCLISCKGVVVDELLLTVLPVHYGRHIFSPSIYII